MQTIWKFPLPVQDYSIIEMPEGSIPLAVQIQGQSPCLWVQVPDDTADLVPRRFAIHGTGHPMHQSGYRYISTFQMHGGALVFHAFEIV
jgi:hypothetical protein